MAQNQKNRTDLLKSVEACLLAVLLVLTLGAASYQMGLGVIGLLIGIVIVLRLFRVTGRGVVGEGYSGRVNRQRANYSFTTKRIAIAGG